MWSQHSRVQDRHTHTKKAIEVKVKMKMKVKMKAFKITRNSKISYHDEEDVVFRDECDKSNDANGGVCGNVNCWVARYLL
mgnify:CR=1 FL=1